MALGGECYREGRRAHFPWGGALLGIVLALSLTPSTTLAQDDGLGSALRQLSSGDVTARLDAVEALRRLGGAEAGDALLGATQDLSPAVRWRAWRALSSHGVPLEHLAVAMADPALPVRVAALNLLPAHGEAAHAMMLAALDDPDAGVRLVALRQLLALAPSDAMGQALRLRYEREVVTAPYALITDGFAAALAHHGLGGGAEGAAITAGAARFAAYHRAPQLHLARRRLLARVLALDEQMRALGAERGARARHCYVTHAELDDLPGQYRALRAALLQWLVDEGATPAVGAEGVAPQSLEQVAQSAYERFEAQVIEAETAWGRVARCQEDRGTPPSAAVREALLLHVGLETAYDDHFLSYRQDVAPLALSSQWLQRLVAHGSGQWRGGGDDGPGEAGEVSFFRYRGELAADLYWGAEQLSGPTGALDLDGHLAVPGYGSVFGRVEGGFDRAFMDRPWPYALLLPHLSLRGLFGGVLRDADAFPVVSAAVGVHWQRYFSPAEGPKRGTDALDAQDDLVDPLPTSLAQGERVVTRGHLRVAYPLETGFAAIIESALWGHFYPHGLPTGPAQVTARRGVPLHALAEPGFYVRDGGGMAMVTLGATWLSYPSPSVAPTWLLTGSALAQGSIDEGEAHGWVGASFVRRPFDAPDVSDVAILNRGQLYFGVGFRFQDFQFQSGNRLFIDYVQRRFVAGDRNVLRGGFSTGWHFRFGAWPALGLTYTVTGQDDDLRQRAFFPEGATRALARNVVMLSLYAPLVGFDLHGISARATEWGPGATFHPVIPEFWWP